MWFLRSSVALTPDKSVKWREFSSRESSVYLAPDAPKHSEDLLTRRSALVGRLAHRGGFGGVYIVEGNESYAIKESKRSLYADWERMCGIGAVKLNVALEHGLPRIGDAATLPNGMRITTPHYYGALIGPEGTRLLMSYEAGSMPLQEDTDTLGTRATRRPIYDAAFEAVGGDPSTLSGYDDKIENLLVRNNEIVKLDASDWAPYSTPGQEL